jgi:hypothetical protein
VREALLGLAPQNPPVMPGLDPGIHQSSQKSCFEEDGSPVKPGDDDFTAPAEREPHPFALYSHAGPPKLCAEATSQ